jgi:hypothetical protein
MGAMNGRLQTIWNRIVENPRTTAAGICALLSLCGILPETFNEEKVALALIAAGLLMSADAKRDSSASKSDG